MFKSVSILHKLYVQVKCYRKKSAGPQKKEEDGTTKNANSEEVWTTVNVRNLSAEKGQEETCYFDPSYDYMVTE